MFMKHYAPNRCEPSIEVIVKIGVRPGDTGWLVAKLGVGAVWGKCKKGGPVGGQGGCERRIELTVKMHNKLGGMVAAVGGGGVSVVVNHESKLL